MRHALTPTEGQLDSLAAAIESLCAQQNTRQDSRQESSYSEEQRSSIVTAAELYWAVRDNPTRYPNSVKVALQLSALKADAATLVAALLGSDCCSIEYPVESLTEKFDPVTLALIQSVRKLNEFDLSGFGLALGEEPGTIPSTDQGTDPNVNPERPLLHGTQDQAEKLRRMLLSLATDSRAILVKLAFRTQRLHDLPDYPADKARLVAQETLEIYAPLANRLGLGSLKWEMEDLCFRTLEPQAYKRTAKALEESRAAREIYILDFVEQFARLLKESNFETAGVFGRPKHIYSIWKKMRNKKIEFKDLFDVRAVRVLVDNVAQCYAVLGLAHTAWQPIVREFDDYIANPKDNGYKSLHTAVIGPQGKPVEIQIRTRAMDEEAELGFAAHWSYKEGTGVDAQLQKNINSLRHLLEDSDDDTLLEGFTQHVASDRVYVFTPKGDVVDLVRGSTPLDFAYYVHSQIGHRCRGAKLNGSIVPLTTQLQDGDQIEILTTREPSPSRDWLNKSLGYLYSSRARSKVRAWFNVQDHEQHLSDGRAILDREMKRAHATVSIERLTRELKFEKNSALYVALARNDVTPTQLATTINLLESPPPAAPLPRYKSGSQARSSADQINVHGVGSLLTQMANCCKPVPYDAIVGYITQSNGVSVHRADCSNILNLPEDKLVRLIEVDWGAESSASYPVDIAIVAYDRQGLLRDVSTVLANEKIDVVAVNTQSNVEDQMADMKISLLIESMDALAGLMDKIRQLRNVQAVQRVI